MNRAHNFSAGPAVLPLEVLEKAQNELIDYRGSGSSIMEMSHRGVHYTEVDQQARERLTRILGLGDDFEIMFLQGGASSQFMMIPYNLLFDGRSADYINTGAWSKKSIKEAARFGDINIAFSSEDSNFNRVPASGESTLSPDASYIHYTSNNTIFGTQFHQDIDAGNVPLVADMSSDFLCKPIDVQKHGIIYAGAQKNLGPAGVTVIIVRKDLLERMNNDIPSMLSYNTHAGTLFNTPPSFPVYMVNLVLEWLEQKGGLSFFETFNQEKADLLYNEIDSDDYYSGTAELASRSLMNVTFRLGSEDLEAKFLKEATAAGLMALKGHRSVGGIRASIYNACPIESVEALVSFMRQFKASNG